MDTELDAGSERVLQAQLPGRQLWSLVLFCLALGWSEQKEAGEDGRQMQGRGTGHPSTWPRAPGGSRKGRGHHDRRLRSPEGTLHKPFDSLYPDPEHPLPNPVNSISQRHLSNGRSFATASPSTNKMSTYGEPADGHEERN